MKNVLMIAFHYPPVQGSSGLQRSLKFSRYLADHDWRAQVLSAHPRAYRQRSDDQIAEIPEEVFVKRAFALDTGRHLSIGGRYPGVLALPDRWVSWVLGAVPSGLAMIRRYRPRVIWSTFPIATAHLIGFILHRLSGVPWVADFRDSMTEDHYPHDERIRNAFRRIEKRAVKHASRIVFTTDGTLDMYRERYPQAPSSRWVCIPNGYDEENFELASQRARLAERPAGEKTRLVHSGIMYRLDRDPKDFFAAIRNLLDRGELSENTIEVILRASGHEDEYTGMIARFGLENVVLLEPRVPYADALTEMMAADGLLIFQGAGCNHQIPAKVYECMRAGRPILAMTDPVGDTAKVIAAAGVDTIVPMDDSAAIERALVGFLDKITKGTAPLPEPEYVEKFSRQSQTASLARLLDDVSSP